MDLKDIKKLENVYTDIEKSLKFDETVTIEPSLNMNKDSKMCGKVTVPKNTIAAFFILMDEMDDKGLVVMTQQELADKLNCSRVSVNTYLALLRKFDYIRVDENKQGRYYVTTQGLLDLGPDRKMALLMDRLALYNTATEKDFRLKNIEFQFDYKLYKVMLNQGYVWKEFEDKYEDIINKTGRIVISQRIADMRIEDAIKNVLSSEDKDKFDNVQKYSNWANENLLNEVIANEISIYCTECGRKLRNHWKYCKYCGSKVEEDLPPIEFNISNYLGKEVEENTKNQE